MRLFLIFLCFAPLLTFSQFNRDSIRFSSFTEVYFAQDQHLWTNHDRPNFLYNHTSTNHIALNSAMLDFGYSSNRLKTQLSLVEGTYANKVTAAEPIGFGALYVGNISYNVSKSKSIWIQAGVFPSHIGLESALGFSNFSLSRSFAAENSPYYESGLSIQYTSSNSKWYAAILALNGWQTMSLSPQQSMPGVGTQIQFKPNSRVTLNHSTYYGQVPVLGGNQQRLFQNLYANIQLRNKWSIQAQTDFGMQKTTGETFDKQWTTGFVGVSFQAKEKLAFAGRAEWIKDTENLVISDANSEMFGYSFNINYLLDEHLLLRAEWRNITSRNSTFAFKNFNENQINGLNLSLAAQF